MAQLYTFTTNKGRTIKLRADSQSQAERLARETAAETGETIGGGSSSSSASTPAPRVVQTQQPAPQQQAPAPQAPSFTRNLAPGTSGPDVTQLQNFLITQGFSIPSGATGYFGDQTKAAVAAWQAKNGIDTAGNPGYFGPRSMAFLKGGSTESQQPQPYQPKPSVFDSIIAGDAFVSEQLKDENNRKMFDAMPEDLQGVYLQTAGALSKAVESGKVVNPDVEITPDKIKEFTDQATAELEPYYQEKYAVLKSDIERSLSRQIEDYNKGVARRAPEFKKKLEDQANTEAESGTTYSSGRDEREGRIVTDEQNVLNDAATGVARNITDLGVNYEKSVGSDKARTLNIPGLDIFSANRTGTYAPTGTRSLYSPVGNVNMGEIGANRTTAIKTRSNELEEAFRGSRILDLRTLK